MTKENRQAAVNPIGANVPRMDAREKVTGTALYADDIQFGNSLLHARIKRSPHPHALIKKINVEKARSLPGVKAVVTGADFPGYIGLYLKDRFIFCRDRVRYVGDPVVGVAAVSLEISREGARPDRGGIRSAPPGARPGVRRQPRSAGHSPAARRV